MKWDFFVREKRTSRLGFVNKIAERTTLTSATRGDDDDSPDSRDTLPRVVIQVVVTRDIFTKE